MRNLTKNDRFNRKAMDAFMDYFIAIDSKHFIGKIYDAYDDVKSKLLTEYGTKGFIEHLYNVEYNNFMLRIQDDISDTLEKQNIKIKKQNSNIPV